MQRNHPVFTLLGIVFFVLCAISWVFGSLLHEHEWLDATCTEPRTCKTCGKIDGEPLGHDWIDATCTTPKTCRRCSITQGYRADHTWIPATCTEPEQCSVCGKKRHWYSSALGHDWVDATYTMPKVCSLCGETEGEPLHRPKEPQEYDKVQQFFINLSTDVTMEEIEKLASECNLFCYSRRDTLNEVENFMVYTISEKEFVYGSGSYYIGKQSNSKNVTTCVVAVFNCSNDVLEYILYLQDYGPYNGFGEALYYNCGRFGDADKILWDEYVEEDIGNKYYYYEGRIEYSYDEEIINVTFRDDDDVPYYYKGRTIQTGFRKCNSAKEAINYTLSRISNTEN